MTMQMNNRRTLPWLAPTPPIRRRELDRAPGRAVLVDPLSVAGVANCCQFSLLRLIMDVVSRRISYIAGHTETGLQNAYIFTLAPNGDGDITFVLKTNEDCDSAGICTTAGVKLMDVPAALTIKGPNGVNKLSVADATASEEDDASAESSPSTSRSARTSRSATSPYATSRSPKTAATSRGPSARWRAATGPGPSPSSPTATGR